MHTAREFTNRLVVLLREERHALAEFILALADFDAQRLWEPLGYPSLFPFLRRELGLSEGVAFYRMKAAQVVQQFPDVIEPLRDGRLCHTAMAELAKVLTAENKQQVLPRFFGASRRQAEAIAVAIQPKAVVPTRTVVAPVTAPALTLAVAVPAEPNRDAEAGTEVLHQVKLETPTPRASAPPPPVPPPRRAEFEPLTAELSRMHITVPSRLVEKLSAARDALSHAKPGATDGELLEAAVDALLAQAAKCKGQSVRPLEKPRPAKPDTVPAHVKREVIARDGGKCQWPVDGGGICGSTHRVQLDHVRARALGGGSTAAGLRCLCQAHNLLHARQTFGDDWMDRYTRRPGRRPPRKKPDGGDEHPPP